MQRPAITATGAAQAEFHMPNIALARQSSGFFDVESLSAAGGESRDSAPVNALRVLIVEDEALIAMLLSDVLEELGFEVCAVEATETGAVTAARRYKPQLLIVDVRLRQGNGVRAVEQIIGNGFVPHIFCSGDRLTEYCLNPRAVVLQKPFLESDLAKAIERALGPALG